MRSRPVADVLSQPDAAGIAALAACRQAIATLAAERAVLDRRIARFL